METKKGPIWKNSLVYGIMTGLGMIILSVILYMLDATFIKGLSYINYLILIAGIVMGTKVLRDKYQDGAISYGRGLGSGTLISVFAGIVSGVYTIIFFKVIDPGMMDKIYIMMEDQMLSSGLPDSQVEMSMEMAKKFTTPTIMGITAIFSYGFLGLIISLITSAILTKKPDPMKMMYEAEQNSRNLAGDTAPTRVDTSQNISGPANSN